MKNTYYTEAVDFWGLGCTIYSLLVGQDAFNDSEFLVNDIKSGNFNRKHPRYEKLSKSAKSLIEGLLTVDSEKRFSI